MIRSLRYAIVAGLLLAVAGVSYAMPEWTMELGVDFWNAPELNRKIEQSRRENEELDARTAETIQRMRQKTAIAADLVAGRLTLCSAAVKFRELNAGSPYFLAAARQQYPRCSDDERHCLNVLDFVRADLPLSPEAEACLQRCTAELDRLRAEDSGQLHLPK